MDSFNKIAVEFQNPSIQDFLINYIKDKNDLISDLIKSFSFVSQFFRIFTFDKSISEFNLRIALNNELLEEYVNKIISDYNLFKSSYILRLNYENSIFKWYKNENFIYTFLNQILIELDNSANQILYDFVLEEFQRNIEPKLTSSNERKSYIKLLNRIDKKNIAIGSESLIKSFARQVNSIDSLKDFSKLQSLFSFEYQEFVTNSKFESKIEEVIESEINGTEINQYENLIDELKEIEKEFGFHLGNKINTLTEKHAELMDEIDRKMEKEDYDYSFEAQEYEEQMEREEQFISNLFDGLTEE